MITDARKYMNGPALRLMDLVFYLRDSGRPEICPFCGYKGAWDMHIELEEGDADNNPPLTVFQTASKSEPSAPHTCVAMTCPRCGHFSMISEYRVRMHIANREASING